MSMTQTSSEYFDKVAGEWDNLRQGYFSEALRDAAIARAYLWPEMTVADVGAGTGFMAAGLAPLVSQVHVIDGSAPMLDVARRNLQAFSNVTYHVSDGLSLPLADGSVDAVFANMYLHHCSDPLAAIREMARILRPGGRLVLTDMDAHTYAWLRTEMADEWMGFERGQVRAWLREAGLVNALVSDSGQSCCAECQQPTMVSADGREARISVFCATGTRRVLGVRESVQSAYGAAAQSGCGCSVSSETAQSTCDCSAPSEAEQSCCGAGQPSEVSASCCAPESKSNAGGQETVAFDTGRSTQDWAMVPEEAAALSLGCGNPAAMASLQAGEVVLDIGSGAGIDAFYAARKVGPGGRVIGLDMTPAMIERARQTADKAGLQVEFRLGDAEAMPVEDGSVDVILSNCVINLCEDKGKVFEEAHRVLKTGGRLAISDVVSSAALPASVRGDPQHWAGCVFGALPEREYLELVTQAGFHDVEVIRSTVGGEVEGVKVYSVFVAAHK